MEPVIGAAFSAKSLQVALALPLRISALRDDGAALRLCDLCENCLRARRVLIKTQWTAPKFQAERSFAHSVGADQILRLQVETYAPNVGRIARQ